MAENLPMTYKKKNPAHCSSSPSLSLYVETVLSLFKGRMYQQGEETSLVGKRITDLNGLAVGKRQPSCLPLPKERTFMEIHVQEDF